MFVQNLWTAPGIGGSILLAVALLMMAGCASNNAAVENGPRTPSPDTSTIAESVPDTLEEEPITPDPLAASNRQRDESELLGERLGRLDALIRTAPPDSARKLRDEYQRLLSQFTGEEEQVQTGNPVNDFVNPARPNASLGGSPPPSDIDSFLARREGGSGGRGRNLSAEEITRRLQSDEPSQEIPPTPRALPVTATPRRSTTPSTPPAARTRRNTAAATAAPRRTVSTSRTEPRRDSRETVSREARQSVQSSSDPAPATGRRQFINGVAASNAGNHGVANEELPKSLDSRDLPARNRPRAELSYGSSLEESGRPADAAVHYRKAAKSGGKFNHKAYVAQCRALARSGKRDKARTMLVDFIRKNPKSPQVVSARKMLQTL